MPRRLFNFLALISTLLFLGVAGSWLYRLGHPGTVRYETPFHALALGGNGPNMTMAIEQFQFQNPGFHSIDFWTARETEFGMLLLDIDPPGFRTFRQFHTFAYAHIHYPDGSYAVTIFFPAGAALLLTFPLPAIWIIRRIRERRRRRVGHCRKCGYDLRASIGRCPECGTAIIAAHRV